MVMKTLKCKTLYIPEFVPPYSSPVNDSVLYVVLVILIRGIIAQEVEAFERSVHVASITI